MYSFILVAFSFGLFDPHNVATPVNAAVLAITVMIVGQYLRRQLTSSFISAWAAFAVALSLPLIWIASFAMSDSLFALLIALALIRCSKFIARGEGGKTSDLILMMVFSALAWQTRYIGITVL